MGMLIQDQEPVRVVSSRQGAGAERADAIAGELVRRRLEPEMLGESPELRSVGATRPSGSSAS